VFHSFQRPVGREYTVTLALLAAALIFIPALVAVSQPLSYSPAIGASALCMTAAFFHWKRSRTVFLSAIAAEARQQNDFR
jgi:hypothetical protein